MLLLCQTWGKRSPNRWDACTRADTQTLAGLAAPGLRGRWRARTGHDPEGGFAVRGGETLDDLQGL